MRILVTGSRDWKNAEAIERAFQIIERDLADAGRLKEPVIIVHGGARGADTLAGPIALEVFGAIKVEAYKADWDTYGKAAGFMRNAEMVQRGADVCLAFIKNNSRGATHCAQLAEEAGIRTVYCHEYREN